MNLDEIENWQGLYRELAQVVGPEVTKRLCAYYGGAQVNFPKRLWDPQREAMAIQREWVAGTSVGQLARQHNYSSRTIRRILAKFSA